MMNKYKKQNSENEYQYIIRICSMKDEDNLTWSEIADILNQNLGHSYSDSCYRKKVQSYYAVKNAVGEFDELEKLNDIKTQIQEERYKLQATKKELNTLIRQKGRFSLFYENIKRELSTLPVLNHQYYDENFETGKEYVLTIADIHCGAKFSLPTNEYSIEECNRRFNKLLAETIKNIPDDVNKIKVVCLGDTIQGLLRINDVKLNESSVVEATVAVSQIISEFLNQLSAYYYVDYYHVSQSNHSQIRPLGTKASEMASEDIEYIIGNYIKDVLVNNHRVNVNLSLDKDFTFIPIFKFNVIATHGHTISNIETALKDLSAVYQQIIDYIIMGHYHNSKSISGNEVDSHDTEILLCPSFQGTDPYAFNKLKKSQKASCKIFVFDEKYGCTETKKIILN